MKFANSIANKNKPTIIIVATATILFILAMRLALPSLAQPTDNVTVDVNISALGEITLLPTAISWVGIQPGIVGGERNLTIKNTGSVNVTNIFSYVSTLDNETTSPYSGDIASAYSATGLLVFRNETNNSYSWAGRIEWNWTDDINNLQLNESTFGFAALSSRGYFRNASNSYVWVLAGNTTHGRCNDSGVVFAIEDTNDDGTIATRAPNATSIAWDGATADYGYFSVNRGSNFLAGMCIAVSTDCTKIYAYKYDKRVGSFDTCLNSANVVQKLVPNEIERVVADIYVPKGMPRGDLKSGLWYFQGTAVG